MSPEFRALLSSKNAVELFDRLRLNCEAGLTKGIVYDVLRSIPGIKDVETALPLAYLRSLPSQSEATRTTLDIAKEGIELFKAMHSHQIAGPKVKPLDKTDVPK